MGSLSRTEALNALFMLETRVLPLRAERVSLPQGTKKMLEAGKEQTNTPHSPWAVMEGSEKVREESRRLMKEQER